MGIKLFIMSIVFYLSIISGCSQIHDIKTDENVTKRDSNSIQEQFSDNVEIAQSYLEERGYEVISLVSESSEELTQRWIESIPGEQEWNVQPIEPDEYIGKSIARVRFVLDSHPLNSRYAGEINVTVLLFEGKVIGGTSFGVDYDGGFHYLDGN